MFSLDELMKQRNEAIQNISYETNLASSSPHPEYNEQYLSMDKIINERECDEDSYEFDANVKIKYFLKFEDTKISINNTGCLESNPPILVFSKQFIETFIPYTCDNFVPFTTKTFNSDLLFEVEIKDKTFTYNFGNKGYMYISEESDDSRFDEFNIKPQINNKFIKFSISNDNFYRIIFSYNDDEKCLTFEHAYFRMIEDDLYKAMNE